MKKIAILGSTGSIGTQALEVIAMHPDLFSAEILVANNSVELLAEQARQFQPNVVVIGNEAKLPILREKLKDLPIKIFAGVEAIEQVVQMSCVDLVLVALVGFSGLRPTRAAILAGKTIALANKETLVVAGQFIMGLAKERRVPILPVDSEHSAIFQCLNGEYPQQKSKIILTASGGPFRGKTIDELKNIKPCDALKHPNWSMGHKVTIDSASMMNKGLESIEAKWLFDLTPEQIEIVVHPQSIVHSLVEFVDGSLKAQLGMPDMRLPIQYALTFPDRLPSPANKFHFTDYKNLTFEQPDFEVFRNLGLAFEAMKRGGNAPCILNAANEVAVEAFLKEKISFLEMSKIIEKSLEIVNFTSEPSFDDLFQTDAETRKIAEELIK